MDKLHLSECIDEAQRLSIITKATANQARLADAERAGVEWDRQTGIAPSRNQCELANRAENEAAMRMARMKPTTPAGAGAMVDYVRRELVENEPSDWMMAALETAAAALAEMRAPIT